DPRGRHPSRPASAQDVHQPAGARSHDALGGAGASREPARQRTAVCEALRLMTTGRSVAPLSLWAILTILGAGGCSASAVLDVGYPSATATAPSMRAPAQARRVVIQRVADQRMDRTRIGPALKNGQAMVSRRPLTDIVRDALTVELTKA